MQGTRSKTLVKVRNKSYQITIYIPTVQSRFCQVVGTGCSTYSTSVDNRHNASLFTSYATLEGLTVPPSFSLQPPFDALSCLSMPPSRSVGILLFLHSSSCVTRGSCAHPWSIAAGGARRGSLACQG